MWSLFSYTIHVGLDPQFKLPKSRFNRSKLNLELHEPYVVKVARTILKGECGRKPTDLLSNPAKRFMEPVKIDGVISAWTDVVETNALERDVRIVIEKDKKTRRRWYSLAPT